MDLVYNMQKLKMLFKKIPYYNCHTKGQDNIILSYSVSIIYINRVLQKINKSNGIKLDTKIFRLHPEEMIDQVYVCFYLEI